MKRKLIIFGLVLPVVILTGVLLWPYLKSTVYPSAVSSQTVEPKANPPARDIPAVVVKNMDDAETKREQKMNSLTIPKPPTVYAKVIDQTGKPVSGAKVVIAPAMGDVAVNQNVEQTSDSDGTLSFSRKWLVLSITVTKPGYQNLLASSATFQYAKTAFTPPSKPDPNNPVVFVLQRM
jgi:hypothetical protein